MTSRELIDNLLRDRPVERVGLVDSPWDDTIAAGCGESPASVPQAARSWGDCPQEARAASWGDARAGRPLRG